MFPLSVQMQNKKSKAPTLNKIPYFHTITGPTLFFSGEKNRKIKKIIKSFSYLPTFLFSILAETRLFFFTHKAKSTALYGKSIIQDAVLLNTEKRVIRYRK